MTTKKTDPEVESEADAADAAPILDAQGAPVRDFLTADDAIDPEVESEADAADAAPILDAQGAPVRDFLTADDAIAQAAIIGGDVIAVGVAYHVADSE